MELKELTINIIQAHIILGALEISHSEGQLGISNKYQKENEFIDFTTAEKDLVVEIQATFSGILEDYPLVRMSL